MNGQVPYEVRILLD